MPVIHPVTVVRPSAQPVSIVSSVVSSVTERERPNESTLREAASAGGCVAYACFVCEEGNLDSVKLPNIVVAVVLALVETFPSLSPPARAEMSEPIKKEAGPPANNDHPEVTEEKQPEPEKRQRQYKEFEGEEKEGAVRECRLSLYLLFFYHPRAACARLYAHVRAGFCWSSQNVPPAITAS
ncbi:3507_t:CDS:2 [Acaulospora colombiana]|uniref:3507_t:CDS:1 n=1 Tax=Acaulospora colombiana TaxID=27376 RepID=A0ACA9NWG6_9GLOM|nr:3507_t:CDS:2 [Acaulospora colombiana]